MRRSIQAMRRGLASTAALGSLALLGCMLGHRSFEPDQSPAALDDIGFLHYLPTVPVVTVAEGSRAVLMLVGSGDLWPDHNARWDELLRRGAVSGSWALEPGQILDMGTLAYMLCVLCDAPRSLNQTLASATRAGDRRYALRTCVYEGLLPQARAHDAVSGGEMLSALQKAEAYQKSHTANRG